ANFFMYMGVLSNALTRKNFFQNSGVCARARWAGCGGISHMRAVECPKFRHARHVFPEPALHLARPMAPFPRLGSALAAGSRGYRLAGGVASGGRGLGPRARLAGSGVPGPRRGAAEPCRA